MNKCKGVCVEKPMREKSTGNQGWERKREEKLGEWDGEEKGVERNKMRDRKEVRRLNGGKEKKRVGKEKEREGRREKGRKVKILTSILKCRGPVCCLSTM